jgi:hypothetical protein
MQFDGDKIVPMNNEMAGRSGDEGSWLARSKFGRTASTCSSAAMASAPEPRTR